MKAPFAVLLASCLCVESVFSLVCWSCENAASNWGCWRWQFCSDSDSFCATTYMGAGFGSTQSISKGCVPICPSTGINVGFAAVSINCCSSSLCNVSGASSVKTNYLVLAVGILASFFYLFGRRL